MVEAPSAIYAENAESPDSMKVPGDPILSARRSTPAT
jgi:hypothetical protein